MKNFSSVENERIAMSLYSLSLSEGRTISEYTGWITARPTCKAKYREFATEIQKLCNTEAGIERAKQIQNHAYNLGVQTERNRIIKVLNDKYSMDNRRNARDKVIAKDLVLGLILVDSPTH